MSSKTPRKIVRKTPLDNDEWLINPDFLGLVKEATEFNSLNEVDLDLREIEELIIVLSSMGYIELGDHIDETI